ncbi:carbon-nitrogen hydrolase family protein [Psychromonas sp. PT13]|uniref:carbon-nitrogen hydrolase family protein n=1 Tax=Psychromonas sp. PT13 TaxID=3439547 RepID=UPI003EBC7F00
MKILCYQGTPYHSDINKNIETVESTAKAASELGVDVLVFPELFISGYNIGNAQLKQLAQPLDGNICSTLKRIAIEQSIAIVMGFPERKDEDIYNSAIAVDKDGTIVGHHRKVFLFGDQEKALFVAGDNFSVFTLNGYQCGISICYDIEFPETTRNMAMQGVEVVFNPTANMFPHTAVPKTLARARALENGVTVIYANLCGQEGNLRYTGLSAIISPEGEDLARAGDQPAILISDISSSIKESASSTQLADLKSASFIDSQ